MKHFYLFVFLCLPLFLAAQSNYKKGYVVSAVGDTLRGYIDYQEWANNPQSINFKTDSSTQGGRELTTTNIQYFAINGFRRYRKFGVSYSTDFVDMRRLSTGIDTSSKTDTVFLRELQAGKNITLYEYTDAIKSRFYFKDNAMYIPKELIYRRYLNEYNHLFTKNNFQGQLNALAGQYNLNLTDLINGSNYKDNDLIRVISKINGKDEIQISRDIVDRSDLRFFTGGGISFSSLQFNGSTPLKNYSSSLSFLPKFTAGIDKFIDPNIGRLINRLEVSFTLSDYSVTSNNYTQNVNELTLTQFTTSISPQVIYNVFNTYKLKAFIGGGFSLNYSMYIDNGDTRKSLNTYLAFRDLWFSIPLKTGIVLNNNLEFSILYIYPATLVKDPAFTADVTALQIGFNYLFPKKHK